MVKGATLTTELGGIGFYTHEDDGEGMSATQTCGERLTEEALEEAQAEVERLRAELDDSADVQAARAGARARAALLADRLVCP